MEELKLVSCGTPPITHGSHLKNNGPMIARINNSDDDNVHIVQPSPFPRNL